jgi:hypothetical protein
MLNTTNSEVTSFVAHGHINPEAQHEMQLSIMRVLNNAPVGITVHQKQIA